MGWIVLAVLIIIVLFIIAVYNRLVSLKNRFRNAFAQIDVQLQRRHDLIPNLVETANAYMTHERETLTQVTEARAAAVSAREAAKQSPDNASAINALGKAETFLSGSLAKFFALTENYPDLKANETMHRLMEELTSTENRIGFARQAFNDSVMDYNTYREQFPNNFISGLFGNFKEAQLLKIDSPEARQAPQASF